MGFYIRKSIKAGPFRFNLSKSGIGVSTGIKGLRVGTGPRGNYVHMGYGGLYYRKTLNGSGSSAPANNAVPQNPLQSGGGITSSEYTNYQEIESGDIAAMTDSSSMELLAEFDSKKKKWRTWPWTACLCIGLFIWSANVLSGEAAWLILALGAITIYLAYNYDQVNKSVVLFYDMEPDFEKAYEGLHASFDLLKASHKSWHVNSQADILDRKRHAGASQAISRNPIVLKMDDAPYVKTNISIPSIPVGKQTLFFFPDRMLVFENDKVGAVSYADLEIGIESVRFVEDGAVPRDAQIVDHTWRYVNKSGGPDRRFNNNRQIPICQYEDMNLISATGLNERVEFSKTGNVYQFQASISQLAGIILSARTST
jgi:hypothetical protein